MIYKEIVPIEQFLKNKIAKSNYIQFVSEERENDLKQDQTRMKRNTFEVPIGREIRQGSKTLPVLRKNEFLTERVDFEQQVPCGDWEISGRGKRRKQYESTDTDFQDILSDWVLNYSSEIDNSPSPEEITRDLTNASDIEFSAVKSFIEYVLNPDYSRFCLEDKVEGRERLGLIENAFAIICIEYYFCLTISRELHTDVLTLIEDYLRHAQKERWNIDLNEILTPKMEHYLRKEHTNKTILADFYDIIGWNFDL